MRFSIRWKTVLFWHNKKMAGCGDFTTGMKNP